MEFDNPTAWFGLLAVPVAVLLILWARRPREVAVPSLIHWKAIPDEGDEGERRLRLEGLASILRIAAAVTVLVAAIAGPHLVLSSGMGRALIVIDRSASMQTIVGDRTRFDLARDAARSLVRSFPPGVQVRLGALPEGVPSGSLSPRDAEAAIGRVTPSILPLDLEGLPSIILPPPDRQESVFLITDHVPSWAPGGEVAVVSVGGPSDNTGITEFEMGPDGVFVSVGNFSGVSRDVPLRLVGKDHSGGEVVRETTLSLKPGEDRGWTVPETTLQEVRVQTLAADSFPLDDEVRGIPPPSPFQCILVGDPCPTVRRALEAIPAAEIVAPSDGEARRASLTVYYRRLPPAGATGPRVLIDPPGPWGGLEIGPVLETPTGILPAAPAFEDLSLSGVRIREARPLQGEGIEPILRCLPGGETVAATVQGKGGRAMVIAFDTERENTNWAERVSYPVFWAKVAQWAGHRSGAGRILRAGEPIRHPVDFPPARLVGPGGEELASYASARPVSWVPEETGVYLLEDASGASPFAVNLLRRDESRNGGESRPIPEEARRVPLREPRRLGGRPFLIFLFIVLAAYDGVRRRARRPR